VIHRASMEARYEVLLRYLLNKFPKCPIHLIYEAGFKGFNLYDRLTEDGIDCVVIPPHMVTEPKTNRVKTDKRDANRLAFVLESHDFRDACHVPDKERREDRQISRTLIGIQKDIIRTRNRIRKLLDFHGIEVSFPDRWGRNEFRALKKLSLPNPLRMSLDVLLAQLEELLRPPGHASGSPPQTLSQGTVREGLHDREEPSWDRVVHGHPPGPRARGGPRPFHEREEDRGFHRADLQRILLRCPIQSLRTLIQYCPNGFRFSSTGRLYSIEVFDLSQA